MHIVQLGIEAVVFLIGIIILGTTIYEVYFDKTDIDEMEFIHTEL